MTDTVEEILCTMRNPYLFRRQLPCIFSACKTKGENGVCSPSQARDQCEFQFVLGVVVVVFSAVFFLFLKKVTI